MTHTHEKKKIGEGARPVIQKKKRLRRKCDRKHYLYRSTRVLLAVYI